MPLEFSAFLGSKPHPNSHEQALFDRARKYIAKLRNIPGIEMIAVVNSLAMYATHEDSDIDLLIVTRPGYMWLVRFCVTWKFWVLGVWRHGSDIAGNFCLSFFVTTRALDMEKIAVSDDIYLQYWVKTLKPILCRDGIYEEFLMANAWVQVLDEERMANTVFLLDTEPHQSRHDFFWKFFDGVIRYFWKIRTSGSYLKKGRPAGVVISDDMLKFHDQDRRVVFRDTFFEQRK